MRAGGTSYTKEINIKAKDVNREKRGTFYDKNVNSPRRYDNYKHIRIT